MDKDKAIRAAKLTAKQVRFDKASENIADYVADLLRQGRAKEVTDDLMAQADPQRLHHHYVSGNTGMDLPMDQASRMARAREMYEGAAKRARDEEFSSAVGLRTDTKPDGWTRPSRVWKEGVPTKKRLNGVATTQLSENKNNDETFSQHGLGEKPPIGGGYAFDPKRKFLSLIHGDTSETGADDLESIIPDARSMLTRDRTTARFDPRLDHLSHLSASTGGAMEMARHVEAVTRAGGQIAPSKYLPDVPRAVHADGGKVAFLAGNHPDVPEVLYHGNAPKIAYKGFTSDIDREQTQKNLAAQDFRELKPSSHGSYGSGIYLSDSPKVASDFAQSIRSDQKEPQPFGQVLKLHVSMKQPFTDDTLRHPEWKAYIKRALTRMFLPKQYEDDIAHRDAFLKALNKGNATVRDLFLRESQHGTMVNQFGQDDIHNTIRNSGFDGIIAHRPDGSKEYVAFKPEQIKSAIGNNGNFDPSDPDITKAEGGRVGYADGGSPLGLYSKAAQIIRSQPQAKGNVDQLLAMVSKAKGVKPAEMTNAGRPSGDTMSKEEMAQHFEQALPDVQVMRKGRDAQAALNAMMQQNRRNWTQEDWDKANALHFEAEKQPSTKYDQYALPGGENYREHLLHLPEGHGPLAKRRKELEDQYKNAKTVSEIDKITSQINELADDETSDFKSSHWDTPNVLAHVRMDDHDNGKTLHVQEVQSDWGQEGREKGFHDPENPFEVIHKKTKEVVSRHPDYRSMTDAYRDHPDRENLTYGDVGYEKPPQGPYVGNTQQWTDLALKHILTEAAKNGNYDRVVFSPGEANADLYGQRKEVQMLKFLKSNDSGEAGILSAYSKDGRRSSEHEITNHDELAKLLGKENAKNLLSQPQTPSPENGEDRYTHTLQGPLTVGGHGMVDYYKNYVHPGALKLLQQHDPSIKPEPYDLPNGYKGFSLPMTDTARQSILKNGFQAFKNGGYAMGENVSKALALTRRFTKDGKSATLALKPRGK